MNTLIGDRVFVASKPEDIPTGADWLREIRTNLRDATLFVVLLTPRSIGRPLVWYESGVAWLSGRRTLPAVAGGLDAGNVPYTFEAPTRFDKPVGTGLRKRATSPTGFEPVSWP